jgi:hypothetical protein
MKYLLISCCILIMALNDALAQVTKFAFTQKVNTLSLFISQKNTSGESNVCSILDNMMMNQINYLNSNIISRAKKYSADTTKAGADLKSAKSSPDPNSPQIIAARNEGKQAALELNTITQYKNRLVTDRTIYNNIQPLRYSIGGNPIALVNYLNQFSATLQ